MNKPTPAIDENGEFVVATQRDGGRVVIYTLRSDADQIVGECRWWHLDGASICRSKPGYDLIDLDKVRATVERARKARDAIRTAAGITFARNQNFYGGGTGQVEKAPAPARPSFAEALLVELEGAADGVDSRECTVTLADMLAWFGSARRASEGSV